MCLWSHVGSHVCRVAPVWGSPVLSQGMVMPIHHPDDAPTHFQPLHSFGMSQPPLWAAGTHCGLIASWAWMWHLRAETHEFFPCCSAVTVVVQKTHSRVCFLCEGARLSFRPALRAADVSTYVLSSQNLLPSPFCDTKQLQKNNPLLGTGSIKTSNRSRGLLLVVSVNVLFSLEFWLFLRTA